jgi:flagellar basal-body rod protein FlgC
MDFLKSMAISASGMSAQHLRMNIISSNLANLDSTQTAEGGPYRRKEVIFSADPIKEDFSGMLESALDAEMCGVKVKRVVEDTTPLRSVYNPSHPQADKNGYVLMPNVNLIQEMANMVDASRGYEANLTVMSTTKNMALKALDLAR